MISAKRRVHGGKKVFQPVRPFLARIHHQQRNDGDDLRNGLVLAVTLRREHDVFGRRQQAQAGDGQFARRR